MHTVTLIVRARHYKDAVFVDDCNCPLANAAKEQFDTEDVSEGADGMLINQKHYAHVWYGTDENDSGLFRATRANFNNTIIRRIKLTLCD